MRSQRTPYEFHFGSKMYRKTNNTEVCGDFDPDVSDAFTTKEQQCRAKRIKKGKKLNKKGEKKRRSRNSITVLSSGLRIASTQSIWGTKPAERKEAQELNDKLHVEEIAKVCPVSAAMLLPHACS